MSRDRTMIRMWAALAGVALATACGGSDRGTPTAPPTVPDPPRATTVAMPSPDREILVALYNATDGPNFGSADNWLTDAPLGSWVASARTQTSC